MRYVTNMRNSTGHDLEYCKGEYTLAYILHYTAMCPYSIV